MIKDAGIGSFLKKGRKKVTEKANENDVLLHLPSLSPPQERIHLKSGDFSFVLNSF